MAGDLSLSEIAKLCQNDDTTKKYQIVNGSKMPRQKHEQMFCLKKYI